MYMEGHKFALGLFLVLIASGCAEITGEVSESPSFETLALDVETVEGVTGADYRPSDGNLSGSFLNMSSMVKRVESFFVQDGNLSEAPDSVQSMVVALNSSSNDTVTDISFDRTVDIDGYEARKLNSTNQTLLYSERDNLSFAVRTEGDGFYSSARKLYSEIAEDIESFENSSN